MVLGPRSSSRVPSIGKHGEQKVQKLRLASSGTVHHYLVPSPPCVHECSAAMCHAPVNCLCVSLCVKEQKEIQEPTLEASTAQHVLMCPACFLGNYLSLPRNHYKQAAMRANAQALQAGAVACGSMGSMSAVRPAGRSSASSTRVCSRTLSNLHPNVAPTLRPHAHQRMQPATFNPPPRPEPHAINVSNLAPTPQPAASTWACHTGVF